MKEWEKTEIEEGRPDGKISRRQFVKGMAWGAAAISLSSILPGCAAAAVTTGTEGTTKGAGETTAPVSAGRHLYPGRRYQYEWSDLYAGIYPAGETGGQD